MNISEEYLAHYGVLRRSGRYPWGSGGPEFAGTTQNKRNKTFLDYVSMLKQKGLSDTEIYQGMGITSTEFRAAKSIAKNAQKQADISMAQRLKDKGYSNVAIGKRMDVGESQVRSLLAVGAKDKAEVLMTVSNLLADQVAEKRFIDIGTGVEHSIGVSRTKLDTAVAVLKEKGYMVHTIQVDQLGTAAGNKTLVKVLTPPGTTYKDVVTNKDQIKLISGYSEDGGRTALGIHPPLSVSSKRIGVNWDEDGGSKADGVIYVRPGVPDISMGKSSYAQVRIAVDGTHYLKGMAVYKDDLPDGVDLVFNTTKSRTPNKLDAMKPLKDDPENPFGSVVRQLTEKNADGSVKRVTSAMNLVNEAGDWEPWSKNLSSQMLSKQAPKFAKAQLDMTYERQKAALDEIMSLTNPAVRAKLLQDFSDGADASSVHLKAAALPRTSNHVILPINSMKDNEIYAPNFKNGERVVLIRHPHGGTFEIPELVVNNANREGKKLLGQTRDAVGINHKVAKRLSGADFDGDTVLVIPNSGNHVKTSTPLAGLKDFDAQRSYPPYEGMKRMTSAQKAFEMGTISNLITDMTIKGANTTELARAVRHSMVVIDAEKHNLNWKLSAEVNGIADLRTRYQTKASGGASTLISRAGARADINARKPRPAKEGGPIDPKTGKKVFVETGESWTGPTGKTVFRKQRVKKLEVVDDAHKLSSGTKIEDVYANHSNRLKALADEARKAMVNTKTTPYSPSAKAAYSNEVASLNAKLNIALKNRPLERAAQLVANTTLSAKKAANPDMDRAEVKKIRFLALEEARTRTGAKKQQILLSDEEWNAIQAGAISNNKLTQILQNADQDRVKELATPRVNTVMTSSKQRRADQMLAAGYTQAEIAAHLGVALSTLKSGFDREEG